MKRLYLLIISLIVIVLSAFCLADTYVNPSPNKATTGISYSSKTSQDVSTWSSAGTDATPSAANVPVEVSVSAPTSAKIRVNGGSWSSGPLIWIPAQTIGIEVQNSANASTATTAGLTFGGTGGVTFSSTTSAPANPITLRSSQTYYGHTITISVTAGDLIIVGYSYNSALTTISCTDNASGGSNTYTQIANVSNTSSTVTTAHMFWAIAKATASLDISCTYENDSGIAALVYYNNAASSPVDGSVSTDTTHTFGSNTCSVATGHGNDVIVCFMADEKPVTSVTSWTNSFTKRVDEPTHYHSFADRIVSSTGTYSTTATENPANTSCVTILAAFKGL